MEKNVQNYFKFFLVIILCIFVRLIPFRAPNIEPIKIMLNTNIPGKENIQLVSSMMYHSSIKKMPQLSELPLIVMDRPYSAGITSYLNSKSYDKRLRFFFDKESQLKGLSTVGLYTPNKAIRKKVEDEESKNKKKIKIQNKEIDDEVNEILRSINENKNTELKRLENAHKKDLRNIQYDSNYKNREDRKDKENEIDNEYKKKVTKIKKRYKYELIYVKSNHIVTKGNNYVLKLKYGDADIVGSEPEDKEIKKQIEKHEYEPLYKNPDGKPKYVNLHNGEKDQTETNESNELVKDIFGHTNENIMILLQTLFPNSYPVLNNITDSYNMLIVKQSLPFTFKNAIPKFLRIKSYENQFFSYLKIDGKIYTTTELLWVNDIYNHPTYSTIILKYNSFNRLKDVSREKLGKELRKREEKFKADFSSNGKFAIDQKLIKFFEKQKKKDVEGQFVTSTDIRDLNDSIDKIIENIEELINYLDFEKPKYKLILDSTNSIRQLYKRIENQIVKTGDINTKLTQLIKSITSINVYNVIYSKYLDSTEIVLDYETEEDDIKNELKSKYQFYVTFIDSLKEFIRPARESSNTELQMTLEDFSNGVVGSQTKFDTLMTPSELTKLPDRNMSNTGVSILPSSGKDPRLEIYVQLDCIEGELTDDNISKINCIYKSEYLGNRLNDLLYPQKTDWELDKKRLFFNINDEKVQKEIKEKEAVLPKPPNKKDKGEKDEAALPPAQGGGKTKKNRLLPIYKLRRTRRI
jgi:hypothetical protein